MQLILLGLPGAGKGTQAQLLGQQLGLLHISTGDMFREAVAEGTELGKRAQEFMAAGALVPDEVTIGMLLARIARPDAAEGIMLDGFPRTIPQAEALDAALAAQGRGIDAVLYIQVPEEPHRTLELHRRRLRRDLPRTHQPACGRRQVRQVWRSAEPARRRPPRDGDQPPRHQPGVDGSACRVLRQAGEVARHRWDRGTGRRHLAATRCPRSGVRAVREGVTYPDAGTDRRH